MERPTALINPPDHTAIEASKWLALIKHPEVMVILGKREAVRVPSDSGYSNTSDGLRQCMLLSGRLKGSVYR